MGLDLFFTSRRKTFFGSCGSWEVCPSRWTLPRKLPQRWIAIFMEPLRPQRPAMACPGPSGYHAVFVTLAQLNFTSLD